MMVLGKRWVGLWDGGDERGSMHFVLRGDEGRGGDEISCIEVLK